MKRFKKLLILLVIFMLIGCNQKEPENDIFSREKAAVIIADTLEISDYDVTIKDVSNDNPNKDKILAVLSRNIFGETSSRYSFNGGNSFTRYDLARVAINTYAYLMCVEDENLEPGVQRAINDIHTLSTEQQWYIYSALNYGFVDMFSTYQYSPQEVSSETELVNTLNKVIAKANQEAKSLEEFKAAKLKNFKMAPSKDVEYADVVDVFIPNGNRGERLLAVSLQGIVNREKISMYIDMGGTEWMVDYAINQSYINGSYKYTDIYTLFSKYVNKFNLNKYVVYEKNKPFTINTATDIAAAEGRLIINEDMVDDILLFVPDADIFYISSLNLSSQYEAQGYVYKNYYQFLRRDIIGFSYYGAQQDFVRDYPIQMKYPTLWIPGSSSDDYNSKTSVLVGEILQNYPANIPAVGFPYAYDTIDGIGFDMGIGEFTGVSLLGEYGKYTAVFDTVGNLSFHTAFNIDADNLKYKAPEKEYQTYDENKKYVAITMTESGDSPAYIQYGLKSRQWDDPVRGEIPYNYSYGLINMDLLPLLTEYFFSSATENNYFFGSISGLGYNYPLSTFGGKGVKNEDGIYMTRKEIMIDHYTKVNEIMGRIGFTSLGVYGYPDNKWGKYDYEDFTDMALNYMPNCETIMGDMHRPGNHYPSGTPVTVESGQRIYHCSTFWSLADLGASNDTSKDDLAIKYLYEEILNSTKNGQFFQCMAYSWHYGPRRIKMVMEKIEQDYPGVYEFVTIEELDNLYLQSRK